MIVAYLAYYFFKKSVEYRFFPPLSVSRNRNNLVFLVLQKTLP